MSKTKPHKKVFIKFIISHLYDFGPYLLLLALQIGLCSILQFTAWPETYTWPYLINHGFFPYKDIAIAHSPLLLILLQHFLPFFQNPVLGVRIFSLILQICTGIVVYSLAKHILGSKNKALLTWLGYILLQFYFDGNTVWFDHLVAMFSTLCFLFWYKYLFYKPKNIYLISAALCLGIAGISKQTAGWLVFPSLFAFAIIWRKNRNFRQTFKLICLYALIVLIPWSLIFIWLYFNQAIKDFWFWGIYFGVSVLPRSSGQILLPTLKQIISTFSFFIPALIYGIKNIKKAKSHFIILWMLFAMLGIYPRFERFHFQPAIPLLVIIWILIINKVKNKKIYVLAFLIPTILYSRFFINQLSQPVRFYEPEIITVAQWIKNNTSPIQPIYILNSADQLYVLVNRLPATDLVVPTLSWYLELPGIQNKIIESLEKKQNPVIISQDYQKNGLGSYKPEKIDNYLRANFSQKTILENKYIIWVKNDR